ncbi:hypothetical protein AX16_001213 [Volvariella volvacea WC 439]|nr:hypothetical protein AX16_001213 [Volvariella volvacea WC 439]
MAPSTTAAQPDLVEVERQDSRPAFILTKTELKLLGIAGVGFFLDAYDLFVINPVSTMLQYRLYGGGHIPPRLEGFLKAGANIGSVIGQFGFGYAADALGRKAVYGKELMLIIIATILTMTTPTGSLSAEGSIIYLTIFRIILGIGVGGDYPMSASITSDRANLRKRGTMLSYIFSNQGWGSFMGSLITIIVLAAYRPAMEGRGEISKVDGAWRIVIGVSLVPAFGTLYQRLALPESTRYIASKKLSGNEASDAEAIEQLKRIQAGEETTLGAISGKAEKKENEGQLEIEQVARETASSVDIESQKEKKLSEESDVESGEVDLEKDDPDAIAKKKAHIGEFVQYFSEWRHFKLLLGTCMCWFLLDVAFYGINLNQNVVLQQIGFDGAGATPWEKLFRVSTGNMIITALGFVPGYYATILTIEKLGRKWIQIQGFFLAALFLAILASMFDRLSKPAFIVNFALLQFFFNFGANSTTYCYPAEVFPTRYKAFAHGISAAVGKAGAILAALAFNTLSKQIGTPAVLWIFFGCCIAGAGFTLLLPEVKGRDADLILAEEIREARALKRGQAQSASA